jgi:hypothetical protein
MQMADVDHECHMCGWTGRPKRPKVCPACGARDILSARDVPMETKSWDEILAESGREEELVVQHDCLTVTKPSSRTDAPRSTCSIAGCSCTLPSQGAVTYSQQAPITTEGALASLGPVSIRTGAGAPGRREGQRHLHAEDACADALASGRLVCKSTGANVPVRGALVSLGPVCNSTGADTPGRRESEGRRMAFASGGLVCKRTCANVPGRGAREDEDRVHWPPRPLAKAEREAPERASSRVRPSGYITTATVL